MPNSLLCGSIPREIEHKRWLCPPPFHVYMFEWLSGSTVETPNGWPHGNNFNSRGLITPIVGSVYRDIGRFYIRTLEHAHTRARPRAHASTKKAESARDAADLPIFRSCSDGNRSSRVQQGAGKLALRRAGCGGTG